MARPPDTQTIPAPYASSLQEIDSIDVPPGRQRSALDPEGIADLPTSIALMGQIQPIGLRRQVGGTDLRGSPR
jgi:ParB-like chromosome segregation protein Spo0J